MLAFFSIFLCIFVQSLQYNLVGWGNNSKGFIADGSFLVYEHPIKYNKLGTELQNKKIKGVAVGYDFSIFLTEDNLLYELGKKRVDIESSFNVQYLKPTLVDLTNLRNIYSGEYNISKVVATNYAVAILVKGDVFTWGYSAHGALGRNCTFSVLPTKIDFHNNIKIVDIDAGADHMIAVDDKGNIYEWGHLAWKNKDAMTPENVIINLANQVGSIPSIGAGYIHNHAVYNQNQLYLWGKIRDSLYSVPTLLQLPCENILSKSSGYEQFLAASQCNNGSIYIVCVGSNEYGECGYSSDEVYTIESPLVYQYSMDYAIQHILLNKYGTSLFISNEGHILQFGKLLKYDERMLEPTPTPTLLFQVNDTINYLHGGYKSFTIICNNFKDIFHWGRDYGRFTGRTTYFSQPSLIEGDFDLEDLTISTSHVTTIEKNGIIKAWGLFYPSLTPPAVPTILSNGDFYIKPGLVSSGDEFTIFTDEDNINIYAYGRNDKGQLGLGDTITRNEVFQIPINLCNGDKFIQLESGYSHTFALTKKSKLYVWGSGSKGQLGIGSVDYIDTPIEISNLFDSKIKSVHLGSYHSIVRNNKGHLFCFGSNLNNECCMSNGDYIVNPERMNIPFTGEIKKIKVGDEHNLFLLASGKLYGCGSNNYSQISPENDGTFQHINTGSIKDLKIRDIWAFGKTTHAKTEDNDIHIWGNSPYRYIIFKDESQLALGNELNDRKAPTKLKMEGALANSRIIDIFGNDECSLYYVELLSTNFLCENGNICYINGTTLLEKNSILNINSSIVYVRGNLIAKLGSTIKISGDISQSKIQSIDDGCVQIIGGTIHYLLKDEDLFDKDILVVEGCHSGMFTNVKVTALNHSAFECHQLSYDQYYRDGALYLKINTSSICNDSINMTDRSFKWWFIAIIVVGIALIVAIVVTLFITKKYKCTNSFIQQ